MKTWSPQGLQQLAQQHGFAAAAVSSVRLSAAYAAGRQAWLAAGYAGDMQWLAAHEDARRDAAQLWPGTRTVLSLRAAYLPQRNAVDTAKARLAEPLQGVIALYAQRRDYHKVLRKRAMALAQALQAMFVGDAAHTADGPTPARAFVDSAPVAEVEHAVQSGLAWRGKHTLALSREGGSYFFLAQLFLPFELPFQSVANTATTALGAHCGSCRACIEVCPTQAIVAPGQLDARRCISYLTIEHPGSIDPALRPAIGNRIFGCDDCQLHCPWNKYAQLQTLPELATMPHLAQGSLLDYWAWDEATFLARTAGTALRRAGWVRWQRNLAVALGNAARALQEQHAGNAGQGRHGAHYHDVAAIRLALQARLQALDAASSLSQSDQDLLREHINWALQQA